MDDEEESEKDAEGNHLERLMDHNPDFHEPDIDLDNLIPNRHHTC